MAGVPATAAPGMGVVLKIRENTSLVRLGDVGGVTWPGFSTTILDATHQESPQGIAEKVGGVVDHGQVTATIRVVPGSPGAEVLYTGAGKRHEFVVEFPDPIDVNCEFLAVMESWAPSEASPSTLLEGTLTLAISGPIEWVEKQP